MLSDSESTQEIVHLINQDPASDENNPSKLKTKYNKSSVLKLIILSLSAFGAAFLYIFFDMYAIPLQLKADVPIALSTLPNLIATTTGLFLTPVISNMSDRCSLRLGRRRPFLIALFIITLACNTIVTFGRTIGLTISPGNYFIGQILIFIGLCMAMTSGSTLLTIVRAYVMDSATVDMQVLANSLLTCISSFGVIISTTLAGINWKKTVFIKVFGGQIRATFSLSSMISILITIISVVCYRETPYNKDKNDKDADDTSSTTSEADEIEMLVVDSNADETSRQGDESHGETEIINRSSENKSKIVTSDEIHNWSGIYQTYYLAKTMPKELFSLWITSTFGWLSFIAFTMFYTNFVGESIYHGDPIAPENSTAFIKYRRGVMHGSWGLMGYNTATAIYSIMIIRLAKYIDMRYLIAAGYLISCAATAVMSLANNIVVVSIMAALQGFGYASVFNLPFAILASYHDYFIKVKQDKRWIFREYGLDISIIFTGLNIGAIIDCLFLSLLVSFTNTNRTAMIWSCFFSGLGCISSSFIYKVPDLHVNK